MTSVKVSLLTPDGNCDVTRRFLAEHDVMSCHAGLIGKISEVFPGVTPAQFTTYWKDSDGDLILMSRDDEVHMALMEVPQGSALHVFIKDNGGSAVLHPGVICDVCNAAIYGRRYKCVKCNDYDLCAPCEGNGNHSEHPMIRMTTPKEQCFANQLPDFCRSGSQTYFRPRFCRRFQRGPNDGGPCNSSSVPPHFMFAGGEGNPESCQMMNQMAKTMMRNWNEAMHPEQDTKKGDKPNAAVNQEEKASEDGPLDPAAFSAMMEEVSGNFCEALKTIGAKRRAGNEEDEPKEKQEKRAECCQDTCNEGVFDFGKLEEVIRPLMNDLFESILRQGQKPEEKTEADQTKQKGEGDEGSHMEEEAPVAKKEQPEEKLGAGSNPSHQGSGSEHSQGAQNFHMLSGLLRQFDAQPQPGIFKAEYVPSQSSTSKKDNPNKEDSANFEFVNQDTINASLAASGTNEETTELDGPASRIAHSLEQLTAMGFKDDGGWLTRLLEEKDGDVGRVLDVILPARK